MSDIERSMETSELSSLRTRVRELALLAVNPERSLAECIARLKDLEGLMLEYKKDSEGRMYGANDMRDTLRRARNLP